MSSPAPVLLEGDRWLEYVPLDSLKPHPQNPKGHDVPLIRASMRRWTFTQPLLVDDRTGYLAAGHGRRLALLAERGQKEPHVPPGIRPTEGWGVPVIRGWSSENDAELLGYVLADNETSRSVGYLDEMLAPAMQIVFETPQKFEGVGLTVAGMERLARIMGTSDDTDRDGLTPPAPDPFTKHGDVWILGPHRLMCGDCTVEADVDKLLGATGADLVLTDPPYCSGGFQESGKAAGSVGRRNVPTNKQIANDRLSTRGYIALMRSMLAVAPAVAAYIFTDWRMWVNLFDVVESSGYGVRSMIVWDKGTPGMGRGWRSQHELIMFGAKQAATFDTSDAVGNVISAKRTGNVLHTTQKPVSVITQILEVSADAVTIYDPFCGSGTTMIGCDDRARACRSMELDPGYVDASVRRWCELKDEPARRESDGLEWDGQTKPEGVPST